MVTDILHVDTPSCSLPSTQFTQHFRLGTACVRLTFGSRYTSCYAPYATYVAFLTGNLRPVYFSQQAHFLLCHHRNLRGMSERSSSQYTTLILLTKSKRMPNSLLSHCSHFFKRKQVVERGVSRSTDNSPDFSRGLNYTRSLKIY